MKSFIMGISENLLRLQFRPAGIDFVRFRKKTVNVAGSVTSGFFAHLPRLARRDQNFASKEVFRGALMLIPAIIMTLSAARPDVNSRLDEGAIIKNITIPKGDVMARVNVETVIDAPPKAVWEALKEIERWPMWLPMNKTAQFLSPAAAEKITPEIAKDRSQVVAIVSANPPAKEMPEQSGRWTRMVYEEYDLPWPIKNEWVVRNYVFDENGGVKRASWRKVESTDNQDDGSWDVDEWKDGKTLLKYYYRVKTTEGVPDTVFKTAVSFTVNSMIKALRHEAARQMGNPR